jgi:phage head maturation protease
MPDTFQKFIKISKIDKEEKMVYGWASTEDIDSDGEVIKASALEKALPAYMKFPTLREMHQPIAVGKTMEAEIKQEGKLKGMWIGAKVVAGDAWEKVKEGVYPAFSIGGNVLKRVGNTISELELVEISLVDVPANKSAVVELWKKDKISKDAESAWSVANLMINVRDRIAWWKYEGKDTASLESVLELLKDLVAREAKEPEKKDDYSEEGLWASESVEMIKVKIKALEALDFSDNPLADSIRKGVILTMSTKQEELEKKDDPKTEETTEEKKEEVTPAVEEKTEEAEKEEKTEEKEAGKLDSDLEKIEKSLSQPEPEKTEKVEVAKDSETVAKLEKSIGKVAGILAKMADELVSVKARLAKVEGTPAAVKSKSEVVHKTISPSGEGDKEKKVEESSVITEKRARLKELDKIFDEIGPSQFSKQGHSKEAVQIQKDIEELLK